ncbi:hypothetical protein [Brevundimonas sp. NPDC046655]|uniref:hypothetical protein n=1 Tax=unclassified Brevundimonas TaxID=2622653 RepID=UPI00384BBDF1
MSLVRKSQALALAAVAMAFVAMPGMASAKAGDCKLAIESAAEQWLLRYDPFDQDAADDTFDVAVVNRGAGACNISARVELRAEPFGLVSETGGQRLDYALVDERGGADVTPRAGQSARRVGARSLALAPGERGLLRFSFSAAPTSVPAAGRYAQRAYLNLESDGQLLAEKPVTLGLEVPKAAVMGLKGELRRSRGGAATIDLGDLTEGRRNLRTSLYVMSTAGYSVSVRSENRGRLRQGSTDWYVPYGLSLGERTMDLARGARFEVVSQNARVDDYALTIDVGSIAGKRAGDYSDTLTFTVAAL